VIFSRHCHAPAEISESISRCFGIIAQRVYPCTCICLGLVSFIAVPLLWNSTLSRYVAVNFAGVFTREQRRLGIPDSAIFRYTRPDLAEATRTLLYRLSSLVLSIASAWRQGLLRVARATKIFSQARFALKLTVRG